MSMNVHRRHLTTSQRAFIAAEIATWKPGGDRQSKHSANLPDGISQPEAAKLLNVSERSVRTAAVVRDHGTGKTANQIKRQICRLPRQRAAKLANATTVVTERLPNAGYATRRGGLASLSL